MRRTAACGLAFVLVAAACGDGGGSTETLGSPSSSPESAGAGERAPLEAILESWDTAITELSGWNGQEPYGVEGAESAWATGCEDVDRLGDIVLRDFPRIAVWTTDGAELTQRSASMDWDAAGYRDLVEALPERCPSIETGGVTVEIAPLRDGIVTETPVSSWAAIELSAYPLTDPATEGTTPEFDADRAAVLVVLVRHNVVSQLVIGLDDDARFDLVAGVVAAADAALQGAPIEASGSFEAPTSAPTLPPQRVDGVELELDRQDCRNDGGFTIDGVTFALAEAAPFEWRTIDPLVGDVVITGVEATFTGPDGQQVTLSSGAVQSDCPMWVEMTNPPDSSGIGRLDCGDGPITEVRFPDAGDDPLVITADAHPDVVDVEAGDPLQWWGLDAAGVVVAGVFLGDAVPADWQIFFCGEG